MSRGSYFELLKETEKKNELKDSDLKKFGYDPQDPYYPKPKEEDTDGKENKCDKVQKKSGRFILLEEKTCGKLMDTSDGTTYESVLHLGFNSTFSSLREHYCETEGISPYGENRHVIGREEALEMKRAIDYVLLERYDEKIEEILGKEFIKIFGDLSREYSLWKYRQMFPDDKEYSGNDIEDRKESLKNIRSIVDSYLIAISEDLDSKEKYLLSYVIWG